MKCPRCKSEKITFQKKNDAVGFLTNDTFTGSKAVCQECGKTFDPDIAYYQSTLTPQERFWYRVSAFFFLSLFVSWIWGIEGVGISIGGSLICMGIAGSYSKNQNRKD